MQGIASENLDIGLVNEPTAPAGKTMDYLSTQNTSEAARLMSARPNLWGMGFLTAKELAIYADERGIQIEQQQLVFPQFVEWLWQLGLLRADIVLGRNWPKREQEIYSEGPKKGGARRARAPVRVRHSMQTGLRYVGLYGRGLGKVAPAKDGTPRLWDGTRPPIAKTYADCRPLGIPRYGWSHTLRRLVRYFKVLEYEEDPGNRPRFHPYRVYVLHKLLWKYPELVELFTGSLESRLAQGERTRDAATRLGTLLAGPGLREDVARWNSITTLAALAEAGQSPSIMGLLRWDYVLQSDTRVNADTGAEETVLTEVGFEVRVAELRDINDKVLGLLTSLGADGLQLIEQERVEICNASDDLEPNRSVHTLLRLAGGRYRLSVRGKLGGAMLLLTMAETLRLVCEAAFEKNLPEEQDRNYRVFTPASGARRAEVAGSGRLVDGPRNAKALYLRVLGLDYGGFLARFYAEGETELGLLQELFGAPDRSGVAVVNLEGKLKVGNEPQDAGVSFSEDLRIDRENGIYSFALVDDDATFEQKQLSDGRTVTKKVVPKKNTDLIRALENNRRLSLLIGGVFVSSPDMETHNFTAVELAEVIWGWLVDDNLVQEDATGAKRLKAHLVETVRGAIERQGKANDSFWGAVHSVVPGSDHIKKSEEWGRRLGQYLQMHPQKDEMPRPVTEAIEEVRAALHTDYTTYKAVQKGERKVEGTPPTP